MFENFLKQKYWFIPTIDEQREMLNERQKFAKDELPNVIEKMTKSSTEYFEVLSELEKTFTKEQWEIYLRSKTLAQDASFQNQRVKSLQDILSEAPVSRIK